jgi:hypothetical protein
MLLRPAILITVGIGACRAAPPPAHASRDSTSATGPAFRADVAAICDTVQALWRATGRAKVRLVDTTASVASDSIAHRGCAVVAAAAHGLDSAQWRTLYWATDSARGWAELIRYTADGPDGGSRTWERKGVRCQMDFTQDGGDDSDPTYVPSPAVGEVTFCWRTQ